MEYYNGFVDEASWEPTTTLVHRRDTKKEELVPVIHARWDHGICSNCCFDWSSVSMFTSVSKYCPDCGAKMNAK